jgi:hypothetical protein
MKLWLLVLILMGFLLFIGFSFAAEGTVTISLNASKVWWDDSVNASGIATYSSGNPISGTVSIKLDSTTYSCPNTVAATGFWNCTFNAPTELGTYTILVNVTNSTGSSFTNTTTLYVTPNYGQKPIGTTDRVVYEVPMLIQDLNGRIRQAWARVMVWKG